MNDTLFPLPPTPPPRTLTWNQVKEAAEKSGRLTGVFNKGGEYEIICVQYPDALHEALLHKTDSPEQWTRTLARMKVSVQMQLL